MFFLIHVHKNFDAHLDIPTEGQSSFRTNTTWQTFIPGGIPEVKHAGLTVYPELGFSKSHNTRNPYKY